MDANVITSIRKEESELLRKLAAVRAMLLAYGEQPSELAAPIVAAPAARVADRPKEAASASRDKRPIENFTAYGRQVIAWSMKFMNDTRPTKTRELVETLDMIGIEIRGESKINALGALLGRSVDIVSHGKAGWTLADPKKASEIVGKYAAHIENEPPSSSAGGSETAGEGARPPDPAQAHSNWGSDA